jgi:hypothetical protein
MFKWTCLAVAALVATVLVWMVNDLRLELRRSTDTLNAQLPQLLEKTRKSAETLAELSGDIRQMRDLLGAGSPRDKSLVAYADELLDRVQASGGRIGLEKKLFGSGLKGTHPADEWVRDARKEAAILTMTASSRQEVLTRLCKNKFGSDWFIQVGDAEPVTLLNWLEKTAP